MIVHYDDMNQLIKLVFKKKSSKEMNTSIKRKLN